MAVHDKKLAGCAGKVSYPTKSRASEVAKTMRRKHRGRMAEYKCDFCGAWHIGEKTETVAAQKWAPKREQDRPTPQRRQRGDWVFVSTERAGQSVARDMASVPVDRLEHAGVLSNDQASAARDFENLYLAANETAPTRDSTTIWEPKGHDASDGPIAAVQDRKELYLFLGMNRDKLLRRVCVEHQEPKMSEIGPLREALNECVRFFK